MCDDPYCTTCPTYFKPFKIRNSKASTKFDPKVSLLLKYTLIPSFKKHFFPDFVACIIKKSNLLICICSKHLYPSDCSIYDFLFILNINFGDF